MLVGVRDQACYSVHGQRRASGRSRQACWLTSSEAMLRLPCRLHHHGFRHDGGCAPLRHHGRPQGQDRGAVDADAGVAGGRGGMPPERATTGAAVRSVGMPARRASQGMSASGARTGLSVRVALAPGVPIVAGGIVAEGATISVSGLPVRGSPSTRRPTWRLTWYCVTSPSRTRPRIGAHHLHGPRRQAALGYR